MRILIPAHVFSDALPEAEIAWELSHALAREGAEVTVVSAYTKLRHNTKKALRESGVTLITIPLLSRRTSGWTPLHIVMTWLFSLPILLFRKVRFVFFVENAPGSFLSGRWVRVAVRALGKLQYDNPKFREDLLYDRKRKALEAGIPERPGPIIRVFDFLATRVLRLTDRSEYPEGLDLIFCQGTEVLEKLQSQRHSAKLVYLPNGVNQRLYCPAQASETSEKFKFLFVGRIAKRKGVEYLVRAFDRLRTENPGVELHLVGRGAPETLERIGSLSDCKDIVFHGEVSFREVAAHFQRCDVFVLASLAESFSTSVLKAWACGKPVIFTRGGGVSDYFLPAGGILVEPADVEALYAAMRQAVDADDLREMGERGRRYVLENLTWEHTARIILEAMKST